MLVLVVCPENQFCQAAAVTGSTRAYIPRLIAESFKKLLAYRLGDTGQFLRGFLKSVEYRKRVFLVGCTITKLVN